MPLKVMMPGPPGAGKGTQAERPAAGERIPKVSTGDMPRGAVAQGTPLRETARVVMHAGPLVGDDVMIGLVHATAGVATGRTT